MVLNRPEIADDNVTTARTGSVTTTSTNVGSGWEGERSRRQVMPPHPISAVPVQQGVDPGLHQAVETVIGALSQDLLSTQVQMALVNAMSPSARRDMVAKIAGLEASVLMTFKQQIQLVDTVLRRIVNDDGTITATAESYDIPLKDALNLSLKVTQVMVRDLPKIYSLDRIQRQEDALRRVMETHMTRDQQEAVLLELERIEGTNPP